MAISTITAKNLPVRKSVPHEKNLYEIFKNPDNRHRPYVRWWWNGGRVVEKEILRELDLMKEAGIGGVEINTIRFPEDTDSLGYKTLPWLSDEWIRMVNIAADACKERNMVCDIIVGSGWPFGAEFLTREQQLQMLALGTIDIKGGTSFSITRDEILKLSDPPVWQRNPGSYKELMYLRLMPKTVNEFTEGISYDHLIQNETIKIDVPPGEYVLYCFVKFIGYMNVIEGATGAAGTVVNHLDSKAVNEYLNWFSDKIDFTGGILKGKIRAAFSDSFELEGANWRNNMPEEFEKRKGYSLLPYLPYVIRKVGGLGEPLNEEYGSDFSDKITTDVINRVRNDFEHVQIDLFQENFLDTYNKWCHKNGLKSRVQAYGRQLHPIESAMSLDIPECETWVHDDMGEVMEPNKYLSGRGYSMANKFVASGSFLSGNNIVSCEEVTNVGLIFGTTLEQLKIVGDRSNLSGVNHSIMHGFNYSPPQDDLVGWIKFGTYFSDKNTWWPYVKFWMDYKARISAVLQNATLQADVAILSPLEDLWSKYGQQRDPYPNITYPEYANDLWEALHQNGNGCDYISEAVIQQSGINKGILSFGPRSYKTIILMEVESIDPATADMLAKFVTEGGRIFAIGKTPVQSVGYKDAQSKSAQVKATIEKLINSYPDRFISVSAPEGPILEWYRNVQQKHGITPFVKIDKPDKYIMQNYYKSEDKDIFFFVNSNIKETHNIKVGFPDDVKGKQAWIWDAETGERFKINSDKQTMDLNLSPAEAKLIVFENYSTGSTLPPQPDRSKPVMVLDGKWKVKATHHIEKTVKEFEILDLVDFNTLPFASLKNFAGTIEYSREIDVENPSNMHILDAGLTHNGITELIINGRSAGIKWYGERVFDIKDKMQTGKNSITIKVTTLLGNYLKSRNEVPTVKRWDWAIKYKPLGLKGPVNIY